jgi:hypothetical protein
VKEGECEKGSKKHKKDNRQLKKKDKRRFHYGSENPGAQETRRKKAVLNDHNLKEYPIHHSHGLASLTKTVSV